MFWGKSLDYTERQCSLSIRSLSNTQVNVELIDPPKNMNVGSDVKVMYVSRECTGRVLDTEGAGKGCFH